MAETLRWRLAHGWCAAFSQRSDGDVREPTARQAWLERIDCRRPVAVPQQVHGVRIVPAQLGWHPDCDGLVQRGDGLAHIAFGADCPGLVLITADAAVSAHCGWRGTAAGVVNAAVSALRQCSTLPISAFIGPGIAGADYEVDAQVLQARQWPSVAIQPSAIAGRAFLDVSTAIHADLLSLGIHAVTSAGIFTSRDPRLRSFRQSGPGAVQALALWRPSPQAGENREFPI